MTSRANNWGEAEVVCLISIWQERSVADILDGKDRNNKAYEIILYCYGCRHLRCVFERLTCCLELSIGLGLMSPECYAMQEIDTGI